MSESETRWVLSSRDTRGVVTLTLNRPARHNALSEALLDDLQGRLTELAADDSARVVVLTGAGASFCAGADIGEMRSASPERLGRVLASLDALPQPTVARVQGNAFGGALGLIAACDIALGGEDIQLVFSEVRLGIVPAMIAPYVLRAVGARTARRLFLTAERFSGREAARIGLLHEAMPLDALDSRTAQLVDQLLLGGPRAQAEAKQLVTQVAGRDPLRDGAVRQETEDRINRLRASAEGQEGLTAFLEKRPPGWTR
ncbi:MAG: enoyl-CoA hydratase-related protein [Steroidobacteraceae bacterium]